VRRPSGALVAAGAGRLTGMSDLSNHDVTTLLTQPNFAVISTRNADGSILSTVVWVDAADGVVRVNSAVGRKWPTNLERDPYANVLVIDANNPYLFVEIAGRTEGTIEGADEHIDSLAKKYLGQDTYPFRQPGEQRITYTITPEKVRLVKQ
jgi:PPOX class probable F420-dependent enzyme